MLSGFRSRWMMPFMHRGTNFFEDIHYPIERQAFFFDQHVAERAAVEIFHYQISNPPDSLAGKTKVGYVNDVGMAQAAGRAGFALETLDEFFVAHELRRDQLQRDVTLCAEVRRQIHRAHAALSEQTLKTILFVQNLTDVTFEWRHPKSLIMGVKSTDFSRAF